MGPAWRSIKASRAVSEPAARRSMSWRSAASVSMVSMNMAGMWGIAHRLFELLMGTQRQALHFLEITFALIRRHGPADFLKMPEHLRLALRAKSAQLDELLLSNCCSLGLICQGGIYLAALGGDSFAHFTALWQVTFVQQANAVHLGGAKPELAPQPGQIVAPGRLQSAQAQGAEIG